MEKKVFKSIEEEEQDFQNILNQAAQIKSYQMSLERKQFDKLPDFYKEGLYNYSSLKNIYIQSFPIKKYTYESIKHQGIIYLNLKQYDNALEQFIKCLCIYKYIICRNPKWASGDGIKDSELTYIEDKGHNPQEQNEIKNMIKTSLLNISLVYLILKDYSNTRNACDEVLKLEQNNVKALYRKAKSYIDDPKSLIDEYIQAEKLLELAHKIKPNNLEIKNTLEQFSKKLNDDKKKENKVYKNYYHRINNERSNNNNGINNNNEIEKKMKNEEDNGVAQIRMMNLILEMCHKQKSEFERNGLQKEVKKYEKIMKQAKKYRDELNDLLEMDFNNPNEKLLNLSRKEGIDLKDKSVQKYFNDLKMKLINEINEFHDNNLNMMKGKNKENKENNEKKKIKDKIFEEDYIYNKNNIENIHQRNKEKDNFNLKNTKNKNDKKIILNNNNNEQLKHTLKLAVSGILVFLVFYLIKILLGYYLRNKLNIDI